ncbi:MAG: alpha/beta hydrolase [Verrucomicrobiia bacterium]|jgi:hypothetical protein
MRRLIWITSGVLLTVAGLIVNYCQTNYTASFREAKGVLLRDSQGDTKTKDGVSFYDVQVLNNGGDRASGRMSTPGRECGRGPWPAVIIVPDLSSDRNVIDSLPVQRTRIMMAIDCPPRDRFDAVSKTSALTSAWSLRNALMQQVSHVLLAGDYLAPQGIVRKGGITLVGIGTGAFVGLAAAASDEKNRFGQVVLIQARGNARTFIEAQARLHQLPCSPGLAGFVGDWLFKPLDPTRYVARVAPRSLVMINGKKDAVIPAASAQQLFDAALEPKQMVWVEGAGLVAADGAAHADTMGRLLAMLPAGVAAPTLSQETVKRAINDIVAKVKDCKYAEAEDALQKAAKQWGNEEEIKKRMDELGKQIQTARDAEAARKKKEEAEARAAAEKERQQRAEANAQPILATCDAWVKRFDFERACQHIADSMAKNDDADLKARLQNRSTELQLLAELKTTLLNKINNKAIPAFSFVPMRGSRMQGRPVSATAEALTFGVSAGTMMFRWTDFTEPTRYELLKQAVDANNGRAQAGIVIYALETGRANEARQYFDQSKSQMGEPLLTIIKQHFEPPASSAPQPAPVPVQ